MIRAVNASLDPERVGEELCRTPSDWLPVAGWLVLAGDDAGRMRPLATRGLTAPRSRRPRGRSAGG